MVITLKIGLWKSDVSFKRNGAPEKRGNGEVPVHRFSVSPFRRFSVSPTPPLSLSPFPRFPITQSLPLYLSRHFLHRTL